MVRVSMGTPSFKALLTAFNRRSLASREIRGFKQWAVRYKGELVWFSICSMGNRVTIVTDDIRSAPVKELGPFIENHLHAFPRRVNVGFIPADHRTRSNVRVWEQRRRDFWPAAQAIVLRQPPRSRLKRFSVYRSLLIMKAGISVWPGGEGEDGELFGPAVTVFDSEIKSHRRKSRL